MSFRSAIVDVIVIVKSSFLDLTFEPHCVQAHFILVLLSCLSQQFRSRLKFVAVRMPCFSSMAKAGLVALVTFRFGSASSFSQDLADAKNRPVTKVVTLLKLC